MSFYTEYVVSNTMLWKFSANKQSVLIKFSNFASRIEDYTSDTPVPTSIVYEEL